MANPTKNSTTYTQPSRGDYVATSAAKFGTAKFNVARFGKESDYTKYFKLTKNNETYTNPAKS